MLKNKVGLIIAIIVAILAMLSNCSIAEEEPGEFAEEVAKIKYILIDPDSAQFRNLRKALNSKGQESVCGEVNARNRFGGYTGFTKFNVTSSIVNLVDINDKKTLRLYQLAGCAGPEAELEARLEAEAFFNCNVIWNLIENVVVHKEDKEAALDAAMLATKKRAVENSAVLSEEQVKVLRLQYSQSLEQTLKNKKQVRAIKKDPLYNKKIFIPSCTANTFNILKAQVGIKE